MECQICGKPATIHMTSIVSSGEKTQAHYCVDHADHAGLSPERMRQQAGDVKAAFEALQQFVTTNRRIPTEDELKQIGVINSDKTLVGPTIATWQKLAEQFLEGLANAPE